jgi:hypothetical protein
MHIFYHKTQVYSKKITILITKFAFKHKYNKIFYFHIKINVVQGLPRGGSKVKIQPCAGTVVRLLPNRNLLDALFAAPYAGKTSVPAGTAGSTSQARGGIARKQARSR